MIEKQITQKGLDSKTVEEILHVIKKELNKKDSVSYWKELMEEVLHPDTSYSLLQLLFNNIYQKEIKNDEAPPVWIPSDEIIENANITKLQKQLGLENYKALYNWSITNRIEFWELMLKTLDISFKQAYSQLVEFKDNLENPQWLEGAVYNIADSCFQLSSDKTAIIYQAEGGEIQKMTYGELEILVNRIANSLINIGLKKGDAIAIDMPMTTEAVAIYLGIVKMGGAVVSIADSLAPAEVEKRLNIANAKAIFTQDIMLRAGKELPLYQKLLNIKLPKAIVIPAVEKLNIEIRKDDIPWDNFLSDNDYFESVDCNPDDVCNILFSSGTTGEPKAIPWTHTTPIKCATDGYLHQDIHEEDVVAWPTNLGWMMGPWLIFATMLNKGTIALYYGAPIGREFGEFVQNAKINMLGLIPSIVKRWIETDCMKGLDWSSINAYSSTGECSNAQDYLWLMCRGGWKPVIEYCGGTEIGGGFITGTIVQPASPSTFTTPALGMDFVILNDNNEQSDIGELFLLPPSIGLSVSLLNKNHHNIYYADVPPISSSFTGTTNILLNEQVNNLSHPPILRSHGDEFQQLKNGYFHGLGRADDTMNLGGIKISSVEIERLLDLVKGVKETAAIAVNPKGGGPSQLVIYAVLQVEVEVQVEGKDKIKENFKQKFQSIIKKQLNPLFRIMDVVIIDSLPRTASNKVMRRVLRDK